MKLKHDKKNRSPCLMSMISTCNRIVCGNSSASWIHGAGPPSLWSGGEVLQLSNTTKLQDHNGPHLHFSHYGKTFEHVYQCIPSLSLPTCVVYIFPMIVCVICYYYIILFNAAVAHLILCDSQWSLGFINCRLYRDSKC